MSCGPARAPSPSPGCSATSRRPCRSTGELTVAEVLGVAPVLAALDADRVRGRRARSTSPPSATTGTSRNAPAPSWTGSVSATSPLTRRLGTLSGGQVVSLGLAAQLLKRPDVLLLDEPTNNLDLDARRTALRACWRTGAAACCWSATTARCSTAWTASPSSSRGEVRFYGGNFTATPRPCARSGRSPSGTSATPSRSSSGRSGRCSRPASGPRAGRATPRGTSKDAGLPKIFAGTMKRSAQESAGRANQTHTARVGQAQGPARRGGPGPARRAEDRAGAAGHPRAGRAHGLPRGADPGAPRRPGPLRGDGVDLAIRGPGADRADRPQRRRQVDPAARGQRRAGRRTAARSTRADGPGRLPVPAAGPAGPRPHRGGEPRRRSRPALPQPQRMHLLARFLFRGSRIHLPVRVLSGGERLRATLACVLYAEPAPQLLLLDEPTNNLDLVSVEPAGERARRLRGRVRGGQPRRAVPRRDRGGPLAAAGGRAARGDRSRCSARLSGAPVGARPD